MQYAGRTPCWPPPSAPARLRDHPADRLTGGGGLRRPGHRVQARLRRATDQLATADPSLGVRRTGLPDPNVFCGPTGSCPQLPNAGWRCAPVRLAQWRVAMDAWHALPVCQYNTPCQARKKWTVLSMHDQHYGGEIDVRSDEGARRRWRVSVDPERCLASGDCTDMAPHYFVMTTDEVSAPVDTTFAPDPLLKEAQAQCPVGAIIITSVAEDGPDGAGSPGS